MAANPYIYGAPSAGNVKSVSDCGMLGDNTVYEMFIRANGVNQNYYGWEDKFVYDIKQKIESVRTCKLQYAAVNENGAIIQFKYYGNTCPVCIGRAETMGVQPAIIPIIPIAVIITAISVPVSIYFSQWVLEEIGEVITPSPLLSGAILIGCVSITIFAAAYLIGKVRGK